MYLTEKLKNYQDTRNKKYKEKFDIQLYWEYYMYLI